MSNILLLVVVFWGTQLFAQERESKFDFQIGAGVSLLGTGDMVTFCFDNELNYKLNNFFTTSASFGMVL